MLVNIYIIPGHTKWFSVLRMVFLMQCSLLSLGGKVKESHISVLINAGVLVSKVEYKALLYYSGIFVFIIITKS